MGSTISSGAGGGCRTSTPSGQEQYSAVYSTPDSSKTCTLGACVGVDSACVSLRDRDYLLLTGKETWVDIMVRPQITVTGGVVGNIASCQ